MFMNEPTQKSEVARLMQRITQEYEAAQRGFYGFAQGNARHDFMTKRTENIAQCHKALQALVGEQEAIHMVDAALAEAREGGDA